MTGKILAFDPPRSEKKTFDKINYMDTEYGAHQIRLLGQPKAIFVHFLRGRATFRCLGRDCPICANNKRIEMEHPENPQSERGYNKANKRHYVNVLDRTLVKVCPTCGHENKKSLTGAYSTNCVAVVDKNTNKQCGTFITEVPETVSNKVKLANLSETVKDQLLAYQDSVLDVNREKIGLGNFDVVLLVTQAGGKKNITAMPTTPPVTDEVEVNDDLLYDLDKAVMMLSADEIASLVNGVALKDIFAARQKPEDTEAPFETSSEDVKESLGSLFG